MIIKRSISTNKFAIICSELDYFSALFYFISKIILCFKSGLQPVKHFVEGVDQFSNFVRTFLFSKPQVQIALADNLHFAGDVPEWLKGLA